MRISAISIGVVLVGTACSSNSTKESASQTPSSNVSSSVATSAVASGATGATPSDQPLTAIKIGVAPVSESSAPNSVAKEKGFFKDQGLDVQWVQVSNGTLSMQALTSGSVDAIYDTSTDLAAAPAGVPVVSIAGGVLTTQELCVSKKLMDKNGLTPSSPPKDIVAALRGQTVGVAGHGGAADVTMRWLLKQYGNMNPDKDVSLVTIGATSAIPVALEQGRINAFILSPPQCALTVQNGTGEVAFRLTQLPELNQYIYGVMITTKAFVAAHPDTASKLASAIAMANRYATSNPDDTAKVLQGVYNNVAPDVITSMVTDSLIPDTIKDAQQTEEMWKQASDFMVQAGMIKQPLNTAEGGLWMNPKLLLN